MAPLLQLIEWVQTNPGMLFRLSLEHLFLAGISVLLAMLLAIPLAIGLSRPGWRGHARSILDLASVLQTLPGLAVIGFASALLARVGAGVGRWPALVALVSYAFLPILSNALNGLVQLPAPLLRAARGLGMSSQQILWKVELPLALPVLLAGIRTALVFNVSTAALAAAIGVDCLGTLIFQGISTGNTALILAGALPTALLAILLEIFFAALEHRLAKARLNPQ